VFPRFHPGAIALTNCCGVSPLRFPPSLPASPPASGPPELEELLPADPDELPLEELPLLAPEEEEAEPPDELPENEEPSAPASLVCASPPVEPHAVPARRAETSPHHHHRRKTCRIFHLVRALRGRYEASKTTRAGPSRNVDARSMPAKLVVGTAETVARVASWAACRATARRAGAASHAASGEERLGGSRRAARTAAANRGPSESTGSTPSMPLTWSRYASCLSPAP
jgi:hypothetical protein